jgi:hypothetical protein
VAVATAGHRTTKLRKIFQHAMELKKLEGK